MKNNKGFTVVEIIVSFVLTSIIVLLLFELIIILKELYVTAGIKSQLLTKQTIMSEKINSDLNTKKIIIANRCGTTCINFVFDDSSTSRLEIDRKNNTFSYGDYKTELIAGSQFGNIKVSTNSVVGVATGRNNSIVTITIPIIHSLLEQQEYGINVVYQYDNRDAAITDLSFEDILDVDRNIYLIGSSDATAFTGIGYEELGYYVMYDNGTVIENDPNVTVTGVVGNEVGKTYELTYTITDTNGIIMDQVVRRVTVASSISEYAYTENVQTFNVFVKGIYTVELWGAQGGSTSSVDIGGFGGYTVADLTLNKGDVLSLYVGGAGNWIDKTVTPGGYNGGGSGGNGYERAGGSGGGASDIRVAGTSLSNRILVAGGGGGAGTDDDSLNPAIGGAGGGLNGLASTYTTTSYNGMGGTQAAGGTRASYSTGISAYPTAGALGLGGIGGTYSSTYGGGGGGGGYYGGGGGVRYGAGGGGSGFCGSITPCTTSDGTTANGKEGNGSIRITLKSVIYD